MYKCIYIRWQNANQCVTEGCGNVNIPNVIASVECRLWMNLKGCSLQEDIAVIKASRTREFASSAHRA